MKNAVIIIVLILVAVVAYMFLTNSPKSQTTQQQEAMMQEDETMMEDTNTMENSKMMSLDLEPVIEDVAQTGTVTLKEVDEGVEVVINVEGYETTVPQPAHIHMGACPTPGAVVYPLSDVVNGTSTTMLATTMEELEAQAPLAVNVHKSADEASVYTACVDLYNGDAMKVNENDSNDMMEY